MPKLTTTTSDITQAVDELACYQLTDSAVVSTATIASIEFQHNIRHYSYQLPLGQLQLLNIVLELPKAPTTAVIESARRSAVKAAMTWKKRYIREDKVTTCFVLVLDIRLQNPTTIIQSDGSHFSHDYLNNDPANISFENNKEITQHLPHSFGARYFMEELITDVTEAEQVLQLFSWEDWQFISSTLQTSADIWQFLSYHLQQTRHSFATGVPSFDSERHLLQQFINSTILFKQAFAVDKTLVDHAMQDKLNPALTTMSLAQKNSSRTAQMYQQHMQQASILWAQLSIQMIEQNYQNQAEKGSVAPSSLSAEQWQQQLLGESLFSRHELVRTIYKHPKQSATMIEKGYVIHQHSYESLGRHYVLIFYGQDVQQSRATIQPNLATIAQDVATRLPLAELHHVVVFGIEFLSDNEDTFIDIDLWIQPITAMTPKERQLTKKIQHLNQQKQHQLPIKAEKRDKLPSLKLSLKVPSRNNEY